MPWTAADAKRHIDGLSPKQAEVWAAVANDALKRCQTTGGADCEGKAIRMANARARVAKVEDRGLVYGWASIVADGEELVVDGQGDVIEPAELEAALVDFMKNHRAAGVDHEGEPVGVVVEALAVSPAKMEAMGFPAEIAALAPVGAWIGVQLDPTSDAFAKVKSGDLRMFSIEGHAERVPV